MPKNDFPISKSIVFNPLVTSFFQIFSKKFKNFHFSFFNLRENRAILFKTEKYVSKLCPLGIFLPPKSPSGNFFLKSLRDLKKKLQKGHKVPLQH